MYSLHAIVYVIQSYFYIISIIYIYRLLIVTHTMYCVEYDYNLYNIYIIYIYTCI